MDIPYEAQHDMTSNRMCGAAALSMVYRSLGVHYPQQEIWNAIATPDPQGALYAKTYRMTQDALNRGFLAMAVRAHDPLHMLALCKERSIRAILNHRLAEDSPLGHYTVLADIANDAVILHDPQFGPSRPVPKQQILELWRPNSLYPEITGNMLIAIVRTQGSKAPCLTCGHAIPQNFRCAQCGMPIDLQPAEVLGCYRVNCDARMWRGIICPYCDREFKGWSLGTLLTDFVDR